MKLNCKIIANSDWNHLQQIFTGFFLLKKQGVIDVEQVIEKKELGLFEETHLRVRINDTITVLYDMHDSGVIRPECLTGIDFYFKRSFSPELITNLPEREKIYPFGFNYQVVPDGFDPFLLKRRAFYETYQERLKIFFKSLGLKKQSNLSNLEAEPNFRLPPKVIFMARAWNHLEIEYKKSSELTFEINNFRADCIRALKKEFKQDFFGGLLADDYSKKYFGDVLLQDNTLAIQKNYLRLLRNYPICVATKGLLNSNGWKLAEYIALSKAIVSEKLQYETVGNFEKDKNYLEFVSVNELIEQTYKLVEDDNLRHQIMQNNFEYYRQYLRPDKIVWNTLEFVKCDDHLSRGVLPLRESS